MTKKLQVFACDECGKLSIPATTHKEAVENASDEGWSRVTYDAPTNEHYIKFACCDNHVVEILKKLGKTKELSISRL